MMSDLANFSMLRFIILVNQRFVLRKYFLAKKESLIRLFLYTGPALIVSTAYMDPGNYGTDIQGGASLNYSLLWVVWLSSAMAME